MRNTLLGVAAVLVTISLVFAQAQPAAVKIPPNGDNNGAAALEAIKASPRHGEFIEIEMPGTPTKLRTWIVFPEKKEKVGVVLVIQEIFGLSDWVRAVADQLAADGFIAIAPDFLSGKGPNGGGTDSLGAGARGAMSSVTVDDQIRALNAARDYGLKLAAANGKVATIGFCWGGRASFNYATVNPQLNAAVVYYGDAPSAEAMAKINCPVLGQYGENDGRITQAVEPNKKIMADLKKTYETNVYPGAGHGFLRQHAGANGEANKKASEQAWPTTLAFLRKHLQ